MAGRSEQKSYRWTEEMTERLIDKFESFPPLYDIRHKDYNNRLKRQGIVSRIAVELNVPGELEIF